jgi:pSer/pThr/pTyr-binding forkhead associated (FHA) protein
MLDRSQERVSITFMSGPLDGKTMTWNLPEVGTELLITIGRRDGCEIMLDYDSQVSRQHARVIYDLPTKHFYVEDTNSRNGTYVGNDKITGKTPLERGQLFRAGRTWLRVDPIRPEPELVEDLENLLVRDDEGNSTRGNTPF